MKSEKFLEIFGNIDDKFIEEAAAPYKRKPLYKRYGAIAASFLIIVLIAFIASANGFQKLLSFDSSQSKNGFSPEHNITCDTADTASISDEASLNSSQTEGTLKGFPSGGFGKTAVITDIDSDAHTVTLELSGNYPAFQSNRVSVNFNKIKTTAKFSELSVGTKVRVTINGSDITEIEIIS